MKSSCQRDTFWCGKFSPSQYEVGIVAQFVFFLYGYQILQVLFVEKTFFFPLNCFWQLCKKSNNCISVSLKLGFLFCSIDLFVYPYTSTTLS